MSRIDLNCDMGESFGAWNMGADDAVMPWITSANIACGFHAGDPSVMRRTVTAALEAGVAIGAHVGLPDRAGFGRRDMAMSPEQIYEITVVQVGSLQAMACAHGARVVHVKPHGALYHMLERNPEQAEALVRAIRDVDPALRVTGRSEGVLVATAERLGLSAVHEAFADRRYGAQGQLVSRSEPGAVIDAIEEVVEQAIGIVREGRVKTVDGGMLELRADTLCVHGDRPDAARLAQALHEGLQREGVDTLHFD
jgi:UPF0271 protein